MSPPTPISIELLLSILEFEALRDQLRKPQPIGTYSGSLDRVRLKVEEIEKRLAASRKSQAKFGRHE